MCCFKLCWSFVIYGNSILETFELKKETFFKSKLNSEIYYLLYPMRYFFSCSSNFLSSFNSVDLFNAGNSNCVKNGELTNSVSISWISDCNPYYELNCNNNINQHLDPEWS